MFTTVDIPRYFRWSEVPEHLKTKTQLKELRLKPIDESNFQGTINVRQHGSIWEFNLYDISLTRPIIRRVVNVENIEIKPGTIAESLYVINKSAKKSRDTKDTNYFEGNFDVVNKAKTRQNNLYALKDRVLKSCVAKGVAELIGYHIQKIEWMDTKQGPPKSKKIRLLLIAMADYTFHLPASKKQVKNLEFLGEIDKISAEQTRETNIKFEQAVELLNKYLKDRKQQFNDFKSTE